MAAALTYVGATATAASVAAWTWSATATALAGQAALAAGLAGVSSLIRSLTGTARDDAGLKLQAGGIQPRTFMVGRGPTGGKLVYANTWGHENSTPNNLLVTVVCRRHGEGIRERLMRFEDIPFNDDADEVRTWKGLALSAIMDLRRYADDELPHRRMVSVRAYEADAVRLETGQ